MKQLTCFLLLLTVSFHLPAQNNSPVSVGLGKEVYPNKTYNRNIQPAEFKALKTDYLAKSKWQRTTGWILTGTGIAVTSVVLMLEVADLAEDVTLSITSAVLGGSTPETHSKNRSALLITGTAMMVTGVTFLSIAKKNKRKALYMSFIDESSQQLRYNTVMNVSVPSVRLRLQF